MIRIRGLILLGFVIVAPNGKNGGAILISTALMWKDNQKRHVSSMILGLILFLLVL